MVLVVRVKFCWVFSGVSINWKVDWHWVIWDSLTCKSGSWQAIDSGALTSNNVQVIVLSVPVTFSHLCLGWRLTLPGPGWWLPRVYSALCVPGLMAVVGSNNKDKGCYQSHIKSSNQLMFLKCVLYLKKKKKGLPWWSSG